MNTHAKPSKPNKLDVFNGYKCIVEFVYNNGWRVPLWQNLADGISI